MRRFAIATLLVAAFATPGAQVTDPVVLTGTSQMISGGPGAQTDPHVSGSRVSYTSRSGTSSKIHVFDFATGEDTTVDPDSIYFDAISDIAGDIVVFTRRTVSPITSRIAFVDLTDPTLTVREFPQAADARRTAAAIGGDTVAFHQSTTASNTVSAVCVATLLRPDDPAECLTSETLWNSTPGVSPDGSTVVFQVCISPNVACDIHAAHRSPDGSWGAAVAITSGAGNDLTPETNGNIVVYASDAAEAGDFDIYYKSATGAGPATRLELTDAPGSDEENPNLAGNLITFERTLPGEVNSDLYVFDIGTNTLFRLPATPDVDERLNDITVEADGTVHVVWAQVDPLTPLDGDNVYAFSFTLGGASYEVCPLFDTARSFKAGRVAPLRIQLCDANGTNLSDPELVLTATGLVQQDSSASSLLAAESPGQANADGVFRYDAALGGYVFNLSTSGLASGTWELHFRVSGDTAVYGIRFDVK